MARKIEVDVIAGNPDPEGISRSYVEPFNLGTRMEMCRFTRLLSGFAKKIEKHRPAIAAPRMSPASTCASR